MNLLKIIKEGRAEDFCLKVQESGFTGLALDNYVAIDILDEKFRIVKTDTYANAYRIVPEENGVKIEVLEESCEFKDIAELFSGLDNQ